VSNPTRCAKNRANSSDKRGFPRTLGDSFHRPVTYRFFWISF
jgi:hypothetical protein